ncbi:MAG: efflux RND transporter periplasmic adaptor subunit [Armatimonadetes bacterium]|nr:efflux RND transporter periplasmic adaptor subunit [Armatimonadota bacterium]
MIGWARRYRYLLIALLVIVAWVVVSAVRGGVPEVEVARAEYGSLTLPLAASGLVEARAADVGFKQTGRIVAVYVEEGERIEEGQLLARIFPAATLGVSGGDLGDVIQAPYDGAVVVIYQRAGAVVNPGAPVLRLVETGAEWVTVFAEPEDAARLRRGQKLTCRAGGYLSQPLPITVEEVGREAVPRPDLPASSRQVRVRCKPAGLGFPLPPGAEVDVDGEIPLLAHGLLLPANAVMHDGGENAVWVVQAGDTVQRRKVMIGPNNFDRIAITEGLKPGETVVVMGKENLQAGQRVRPKAMAAPEAQP